MADEQVVDQTQTGSTTTETTSSENTGTTNSGTNTAQTASTQKPTTGTNSGDEDRRFKGIQADLAKERKARQQFETQFTSLQAELAAEKRRVQALAGVNPQKPEEAEAEEVRARFAALYPHLGGLTAEDIENMRAMAEERKGLKETTNHYWKTHGQAMVGSVQKEIEAVYGGELNKRQLDAVTKAYVLRAQADPEFLTRHENGDPTLAKEFAKEWVEDWFEPARRKVTATEVNQFRKVPNGQSRSIVNQGEKKIDVTDSKAVEDLLVAGYREKGGQFGHR